mmetsp:Transcript_22238/g.26406  ORF Transcript_22238/g.26406 Transcript_22238/m.26406 type:complete len:492 (+) Transcript_22238:76-1551(+)
MTSNHPPIITPPSTAPSCTDSSSSEDQQKQDEQIQQQPLQLPTKTTFEQLQACQFSSWYPTFRNLHKHHDDDDDDENNDPDGDKDSNIQQYEHKNVTIRSIVIKPLPIEFLEYLKGDGITLPRGATKLSSFLPDNNDNDDVWSSDDNDDDEKKRVNNEQEQGENSISSSEEEEKEYHFPILNEQIQNAIERLGGSILPKLNWSSPKDVTWLNASTLKCLTVGDVYLMLKSSDFCMHDLTHALDDLCDDDGNSNGDDGKNTIPLPTVEYELVLRKWSNLHDSMEFRCFVGNDELVAISQRHHTQHFPHLNHDSTDIRSTIIEFFIGAIRDNFDVSRRQRQHNIVPGNYVFDVYVDKDHRAWLIDFNVWSIRTDSLLFTWDELVALSVIPPLASKHDGHGKEGGSGDHGSNNSSSSMTEKFGSIVETDLENVKPEMRVVTTENEVHYDPLSSYRGPIDAVDLASEEGGGSLRSFQEFMKMCEKPSKRDDDADV